MLALRGNAGASLIAARARERGTGRKGHPCSVNTTGRTNPLPLVAGVRKGVGAVRAGEPDPGCDRFTGVNRPALDTV